MLTWCYAYSAGKWNANCWTPYLFVLVCKIRYLHQRLWRRHAITSKNCTKRWMIWVRDYLNFWLQEPSLVLMQMLLVHFYDNKSTYANSIAVAYYWADLMIIYIGIRTFLAHLLLLLECGDRLNFQKPIIARRRYYTCDHHYVRSVPSIFFTNKNKKWGKGIRVN